ncbi:MAG: nitronate monooxygenase [Burkholderiales bacterium]|nr:nitronate monooxygenase [Burkholderiales bacterium]
MSALRTALSARLGLALPLFQAPMAGLTTPALVAAAVRAGVLGSFGCAYRAPADIEADAQAVRAVTDGPFNLNFFVAPQPDPIAPDAQTAALDAIAPWYREIGLPPPQPLHGPYAPDLDAQLAAAARVAPAVVTFHLGVLPAERVQALRRAGALVGGSATCLDEAHALAAAGCDFVVAQGGEAGGHRGTWLRDPHDALTGTLALVRLLVRDGGLPVVAAGGIMDGDGIAAVLALGAQAAQLGTAFIACPESGASAPQRAALLAARDDATRLSDKFTGKPARGLVNRFMREARDHDIATLPFPAQLGLTAPLRAPTVKQGSADFLSLWAGQAVALSRALAVADLVAALTAETHAALDRLQALREPASASALASTGVASAVPTPVS